ncbi:nitroreductase family protein [Gordoniibacillus kamchatkensis]|uniref:nitroreductase family protein n=1 Tax=Gordoniibacillus kamchatkensis TaxID=1590651 RepID=UPI0022B0B917|nr:nitroreductase family protein [Paenibacillus sp. VKM B-2647]
MSRFVVMCADFYRLKLISELHGTSFKVDEVENVLVGAVDTALAAENLLLAARSFGLGGVMIGGIRNNPEGVAALLKLPAYTIPIMGICLGYPAEQPWQKPRLPQRVVVHEETYDAGRIMEGLEAYDATMADYYSRRSSGRITGGWTPKMAEYLSAPRRAHLRTFIEGQGFGLK